MKNIISVIIPFYNLGQYLDATLRSCLNQSHPSVEIICINDGSDQEESILKYSIARQKYGEKITFIDQNNQGLSATRNNGIKMAKGEYICCLDADDIVKPTYLEEMHRCMIKNEEIGIVSSWIELFGEENYIYKTKEMTPESAFVENTLSVASLFRKGAWAKIGGYDEKMRDGYEDWDLWISIIESGYTSSIVEQPLFRYRKRHNSMLHTSDLKRGVILKYIIKKHETMLKAYAFQVFTLKELERTFFISQLNFARKNLQSDQIQYAATIRELEGEVAKLQTELNSIHKSIGWRILQYVRIHILDKFNINRADIYRKLIK